MGINSEHPSSFPIWRMDQTWRWLLACGLLLSMTTGVDFTNMFPSNFYAHKCSHAQLLFHLQTYAQLCQYAQLEFMFNLIYWFSVNLLVQKLPLKYWWNWPQSDTFSPQILYSTLLLDRQWKCAPICWHKYLVQITGFQEF